MKAAALVGEQAALSQTQGIEAEFAKQIGAESPTPRSGDAPKNKYQNKHRLTAAYANRDFRTRRHGANVDLGMPARSAYASMANGWRGKTSKSVIVVKPAPPPASAQTSLRRQDANAERMETHWWARSA